MKFMTKNANLYKKNATIYFQKNANFVRDILFSKDKINHIKKF